MKPQRCCKDNGGAKGFWGGELVKWSHATAPPLFRDAEGDATLGPLEEGKN